MQPVLGIPLADEEPDTTAVRNADDLADVDSDVAHLVNLVFDPYLSGVCDHRSHPARPIPWPPDRVHRPCLPTGDPVHRRITPSSLRPGVACSLVASPWPGRCGLRLCGAHFRSR